MRAQFIACAESGRAELTRALERELTMRMQAPGSFHAKVKKIVAELKALEHDLWSFDESDDFEIWLPSWVEPSGPGLLLTFTPDGATVEWQGEGPARRSRATEWSRE